MTQIRVQYLKWMTVYLWYSNIPACDHEQKEFRLLAYTSLGELRASLLRKLQDLPIQRVYALGAHAWQWIKIQDTDQLNAWYTAFDIEQKLATSKPRPSAELSLIDVVT